MLSLVRPGLSSSRLELISRRGRRVSRSPSPPTPPPGDVVLFVVPTNIATGTNVALVARTWNGTDASTTDDILNGQGAATRPPDLIPGQTMALYRGTGTWHLAYLPMGVARLTGATFTGAVSGVAPATASNFATKAYVDGLITPVQTHLNYIAISADTTITAAEYLAGGSSMTADLIVPTYSGVRRYIAIAVPDSTGDITDIQQNGVSIFGAWVRIAGTISVGGEDHKAWRTVDDQSDLASGLTYSIVQA